MADLGRARYSQVQPVTARYSLVQPGTARYSAEKTHHVLYFRKAGTSRISNMILRGHKQGWAGQSIFQRGRVKTKIRGAGSGGTKGKIRGQGKRERKSNDQIIRQKCENYHGDICSVL